MAATEVAHVNGCQQDSSDEDANATETRDGREQVEEGATSTASSKRKRKKKKKKAASKDTASADAALEVKSVLKISRAKHWKYISSYHGQWLQLPHEILDTLLVINCGPHDDAVEMAQSAADLSDRLSLLGPASARRAKLEAAELNHTQHYPSQNSTQGKDRLPPPIDAAVFRGVNQVRRLVEEASDLATRAASGLLSAALGAFSSNVQQKNSPYDDLFGSPYGNASSNGRRNDSGRSQMMSPTRQLRLRSLAVSKLAAAYRIDEVAASVAVMQGSTALDDLADKVLKQDAGDVDARYVQFFHEKIPSRTLAQSSPTETLDLLIAQNPNRLEFYRTKSVIHAAKHEFAEATQTLTQALLIARTLRKAKSGKHGINGSSDRSSNRPRGKGKKGRHQISGSTENQVDEDTPSSESISTPAIEEAAAIGHEAGDDLERQLLFHRGMAYFHWAFSVLEDVVLKLEGVAKPSGGLSNEGGEATLEAIGIKGLSACGLLGHDRPDFDQAFLRYANVLKEPALQSQVSTLLARSVRDHEKFLSYFPLYQPPVGSALSTDKRPYPPVPKKKKDDKINDYHIKRIMQHRSLEGRTRYTHPENGDADAEPTVLTTYHPLLVESHFTILISDLMLGDFVAALRKHYQLAAIMSTLEGFPVFLPARSISQAQYTEILERLGVTWLAKAFENGSRPPTGTEDNIAESGHMPCLHHLVSFFSPDYNQLLADAAERAACVLRLYLQLTNEELTACDSNPKQAQGGRLAITNGDTDAERKANAPILYSARAEIAAAWLYSTIIPKIQQNTQAETESQEQREAGSSSRQNGKGKARE